MADTPFPVNLRALKSRLKMKHLELFRNVCDKQTLHRAAEASAMTQPAATKLIQELENMLGVQLFERGKQGMRPTHYGEVVRRHVATLLADVAAMQEEVAFVSQGAVGLIRLGVVPSLSADLMSLAIANLLQEHPRVQFKLEERNTTELLASLARNDLDLTFGRVLDISAARDLRIAKVYSEPLVIVARQGHALTRMRKPDWKLLGKATWALPAAGTPMRHLVDNLFTRHSMLRPLVAVEYSTFEKTQQLIVRSNVLGVLPRSMALQGKASGELALIQPEVGVKFAPISLIFRKQFDPPPVVRHFERAVHAAARSLELA